MKNLIVVPLDFDEQSMIALEQGANVAEVLQSDIILLHVSDEPGKSASAKAYHEEKEAETREKLDVIARNLATESGLKVSYEIRYGKVYREICDFGEEKEASLIVMGCNSYRGLKRFIGSNALRVVRESKTPVITIKGKSHRKGCERILLPLDLTKETREKVARALDFARAYGSEIFVMSVRESDKFDMSALTRQMNQVQRFIEDHGVKIKTEFVEKKGSVAETIIEYGKQNEIDLIMIMTQQEQDITELFIGSQAQELINKSEIPVLSVIPRTTESNAGSVIFS